MVDLLLKKDKSSRTISHSFARGKNIPKDNNSNSSYQRGKLNTTCSFQSGHHGEADNEQGSSKESGHPDLFQLFSFKDLEEGDVQKSSGSQALEER